MEGQVRDIVRFVQSMRKNAGFAVEDRIEISWDFDGEIANALGKFDSYFRNETLTSNIIDVIEKCDHSEKVELNGKHYLIALKKI
jgi:isoleucyl-tRNA synthetase